MIEFLLDEGLHHQILLTTAELFVYSNPWEDGCGQFVCQMHLRQKVNVKKDS